MKSLFMNRKYTSVVCKVHGFACLLRQQQHGVQHHHENYKQAYFFLDGKYTAVRTFARHAKEHHGSTYDYYNILKISPQATQSQIKTAYYKLCLIHHPDKNKGTKESEEKFAAINEAYRVLHDSTLRKQYDRSLARYGAPTSVGAQFQFKPLQKNNSYDEWTRAHYGNAFKHSKTLHKSQEEFIKRRKALEKQTILNARIIPTVVILSLSLLLIALFD